jgi:PadR family transcriptional regulator PadR
MARIPNRSKQTLQLFAAFLEQPLSWRHGYDLSKLTGLKSGTLYPILMRLREQGLLEDRWEESEGAGRPHRHAYRLTPAGRNFVREALAPPQPARRAARVAKSS